MRHREVFLKGLAHLPSGFVGHIDIDHLKDINDYQGLPHGDLMVKLVAVLCEYHAGYQSQICRWTGNSFALYFSEGMDAVSLFIERVQASLVGTNLGVTVSGGVVKLSPGETVEQAISRAIRLTLSAIARGRNQILIDD
jgi:GGDEF domain-containing protein